jgi:hypothetical protein
MSSHRSTNRQRAQPHYNQSKPQQLDSRSIEKKANGFTGGSQSFAVTNTNGLNNSLNSTT